MLDGLRAFARTPIAKVLFAILIVSFAAFGINNVATSLGSSTVAKVGDMDISVQDFQQEYDVQVNAFAQQYGQLPTPDIALAAGIPSMALENLAYRASIERLSQQLGIGVSEQRLGKMLREGGDFTDILGNFD